MARRAKRDDVINVVPQMLGMALLLFLLIPGGLQLMSTLGSAAFWSVAASFLMLAGLIGYRVVASRAHREKLSGMPSRSWPSDMARIPEPDRTSVEELVQRLRAIDGHRFEKILAATFGKYGFRVERLNGTKRDEGIDLILTDNIGQRTAVQCVHGKTWNVGVKAIHEFTRALKTAGLQKGIIIALRGYTGKARRAADSNGVELVDQTELSEMLEFTDAQLDPEILESIRT